MTFPTYVMDSKNTIQGPTRAWYAPYVPAGGDPPENSLVSVGMYTEDGIEIDPKITFGDVKIDQSSFPITTFVTDQEMEVKITWLELSAGALAVALGLQPGALTGPPPTIGGGDFWDIAPADGIPSARPTFRTWLFQVPSPGHDETTDPIAAYSTLRLFRAHPVAHGTIKVGKKHQGKLQTTIHGYLDETISSRIRVWDWVMP